MNPKPIKLNNAASLYYDWTAVANVFLLAALVFMMMYFVIVSNIITSSKYKLGLLGEELAGLNETNAVLTAQKLSIEDSTAVLNFARSNNMVEAGHVRHIFENDGVALQR